VFTKRVESLVGPASYRAVITFRWIDRKGHVLRSAIRTSTACEQPDPRPELVLGGVDMAAGPTKGSAVYTVAVTNDGRATAGAFTVTVAVDGVLQPELALGPLTAGERRQGTIAGTRCAAGSTITVTVDAGNAVDEREEADDVVERPCLLG
jgi:hypothetical protein